MADIDIGTDWRKVIQASRQTVSYFIKVSGGDVDLGQSPTADRRQKTELRDGDRAKIQVAAGDDVYAQAQSGTVTLTVNRMDTQLTIYPRQQADIGAIDTINDSVDVEDRSGRNVGKIRLMDSSGTLIDSGNRLPVDSSQSNQTGIVGDTITPDSNGATFVSQSVPPGFQVVVQNDPGNADNVQIADNGSTGRHVLEPGGSFSVAVQNLEDIEVIGTASNPTVHATVEAP